MPTLRRTPGLHRAGELAAAGHAHWLSALGHLVLAGQPTTRCGAAAWARDQLAFWLEEISDAELDGLADEMVAEWRAMSPRSTA